MCWFPRINLDEEKINSYCLYICLPSREVRLISFYISYVAGKINLRCQSVKLNGAITTSEHNISCFPPSHIGFFDLTITPEFCPLHLWTFYFFGQRIYLLLSSTRVNSAADWIMGWGQRRRNWPIIAIGGRLNGQDKWTDVFMEFLCCSELLFATRMHWSRTSL